MAFEQERVVVELDGRAHHASPQQWERDLALVRAGWQTVRLSHRRLTTDIPGCRRDVIEVLAARNHTLASHQADTPMPRLLQGQRILGGGFVTDNRG